MRFNDDDSSIKEIINHNLGEAFDDCVCELIKGAANKGVEWLHVYIDEGGFFRFAVIPAEQVIPIWDTSLQKKLTGVIRYYKIKNVDGDDFLTAEWWDENEVKTFIIDGYGNAEFKEVTPHFYLNGQPQGWGRVPFIPFKNNEEMVGDLQFYKGLIDEYDTCIADFANNLEQVQEVVTVLRGYEGTDLREFSDNLRYYKIIKVSGESGSGVDKLEISIPVEAKREMMDRLEKNIFVFGQGVDVKSDKFSNSTSGVALKFLYSLLDMKAGITERKFIVGIKILLQFMCRFEALVHGESFDPSTVAVVFNRRMIESELEMAEIAEKSMDIISRRTIVAHHPWTEDVDDELTGM
ncbi:MAG: phage portal protein [Oscillospiraceae bacterium]|nr:phage portal protein [Oscillospiraceae bacterium]